MCKVKQSGSICCAVFAGLAALTGCAETLSPRLETRPAPDAAAVVDARIGLNIARYRASLGDTSSRRFLDWLENPSFDESQVYGDVESRTVVSSNWPGNGYSGGTGYTLTNQYSHARARFRLEAHAGTPLAYGEKMDEGPVFYMPGYAVNGRAAYTSIQHGRSCGYTTVGENKGSAWNVENDVPVGQVVNVGSGSQSAAPACSDECDEDEGEDELRLSSGSFRDGWMPFSDPSSNLCDGGQQGGGGGGGYWLIYTYCWGYDYFLYGVYQYTVVEGCTQESVWVE